LKKAVLWDGGRAEIVRGKLILVRIRSSEGQKKKAGRKKKRGLKQVEKKDIVGLHART